MRGGEGGQRDGECLGVLSDLLHSLFTLDELQRFLSRRYPDVGDAIGFRARTQASFDAAEALLNRREVDSAFFGQLLDERPKGREEISRAATAFGVAVPDQSSRPTTPVRSRRARHRPASSAPAGDTYTHHGGQVGAIGRNAVSSGNMFFQNAEVVHVHAPSSPSDSSMPRGQEPPAAMPSTRHLFEARTENAAILKAAVRLLSTGLPVEFEARWNLLRQHLGDQSVRVLSLSGSLQDVARTLSVRLLHDFGGEGRQALAKLIRELIEESPNSEWCGAANALLQRLPQYQAPSLISDEQADSVSVEKVHASIQRTVTAGARALRVPSSTITATIEHPVSSLRDYFSRCIAESSRQPIGDRRFVALSLLIDRRQNGQAQGPERFNVERDRYQSLRGAVEDNDDCELVVVGPPGAGKSTLLSQYRYELCELGLQGKSAPIPFLVHLGGYGRDDGERVPSPDEWLAFQWQHVMPNLPLADAMATRPFVLLLDALNEMPREAHATLEARIGVWQDWLSSFHAQTKGRHRVVFSCRARDLSASLSSARPVRLLEIDALDDERVKYFLSEHAGRHADAIYSKIQKNDRLRSLYRTPLSLTLLLDLIEFCGSIPSTPAALFTGHLCYAVRREIDNGNPRFRAGKYLSASDVNHMLLAPFRLDEPYALPDDGPLFRGLFALAFGMQKGGAGERTHVVMKLAAARRLYSDFSVSEELSFDDLLLAAGDLNLLVRQGNKLAFIRQPDQEYLAAQAWAFEHRAYDLVVPPWTPETSSLERVVSGLLEDERLPSPPSTGWEETVLMGAEMADDDAVVDGLLAVNAPLAGRVSVGSWS